MPGDRQPLLSVVVPFYGVEDYIAECLDSLRGQTLTDLQVVLVDDGSPDGSRVVAERFVAADPRFHLVTQRNQGLGPARNTGTRHATGRYLAFVDSDDVVDRRAYAMLVGALEQTGSDFATGDVYRLDATGVRQSWAHRTVFAETRLATTLAAFPDLVADRMVWNKVYRRSFWDAGGYEFPAIRYEDYPVTLRAGLEARAVDVLAEHVYYWRDRESRTSITQQSHSIDNARDRYRSALLVLDLVERPGVPAEVRRRVHGHFVHVDVVALTEAAVHVPADRRAEAEQLALDLARRLDPGSDDSASRLPGLLHGCLRRGDLPLARALARHRTGGGPVRLFADVAGSLPAVVRAELGWLTRRSSPRPPGR